jgi:hypothetical protein
MTGVVAIESLRGFTRVVGAPVILAKSVLTRFRRCKLTGRSLTNYSEPVKRVNYFSQMKARETNALPILQDTG